MPLHGWKPRVAFRERHDPSQPAVRVGVPGRPHDGGAGGVRAGGPRAAVAPRRRARAARRARRLPRHRQTRTLPTAMRRRQTQPTVRILAK